VLLHPHPESDQHRNSITSLVSHLADADEIWSTYIHELMSY